MSEHTPGPWEIQRNLGGDIESIGPLATYGCESSWIDGRIADIMLAAAAPDLLQALEEIIARWDTPSWKSVEPTGVCIAKGRQAVAKAKGEIHD